MSELRLGTRCVDLERVATFFGMENVAKSLLIQRAGVVAVVRNEAQMRERDGDNEVASLLREWAAAVAPDLPAEDGGAA